MTPGGHEPIAVVGIGCRFPGGANDPESFWRLLADGVHAVGEVPSDRFDPDAYGGRIASRAAGVLEDVDRFDAGFFGISPREAARMDPQQRLLLELAWEALEDGGLLGAGPAPAPTGVFVGLWIADYESRLLADPAGADFHLTTGTGRYSGSGRISHVLGLQGPSITVDTACSSSLVAVHLAVQSLRSGECELALAGGANVILQPQITIAYSGAGMMAPDGRCKFGDAAADGYVRSDGAGVVALKPLARALADGDPVYALIRGSAVASEGAASDSLGTPSIEGQRALLLAAWRDAGVEPGQVAYVEAHGPGTRAGDPVELTALGRALAEGGPRGRPCLVGSVKTNIGHTEAAAGVAGLIKTALVLERGSIPPSLHLREPNPAVPWDELPLSIAREPAPWPAEPEAVAGVTSFGISGTNAHAVLAPAPPRQPLPAVPEERPLLLPLSARSPEALAASARAHVDLLEVRDALEAGDALAAGSALEAGEAADAPRAVDVAFTSASRRRHHDHRLAVTGTTRSQLAGALRAALEGGRAAPAEEPPRVVFVFSGQGGQRPGMACELAAAEPAVRETLERCEAALRPLVDWSLAEQLAAPPGSAAYRLDEIDVVQPALVAVELALAALWRSWGVEPHAVVGHSLGEIAAAHVAGALGLEAAMCVVAERSRLLRRLSGRGAMALVELSQAEVEAALRGRERELSVAAANGPRATVVAGEPGPLRELLAELERRDVFCRPVDVDVASHSPQVEPLLPELAAALAGLDPAEPALPFVSTALDADADPPSLDAAYWVANLLRPVLLDRAVRRLAADGHDTFVEIGPHPVLSPGVVESAREAGVEALVVPTLRRDEPEPMTALASLGRLYEAGADVRWAALARGDERCVRLPRYAWQRERHWLDVPVRAASGVAAGSPLGPRLDAADGRSYWQPVLAEPLLAEHVVAGRAVVPAAHVLALALAAAAERLGAGPWGVERASFVEGLVLPGGTPPAAQLVLSPRSDGADFELLSRADGADAAGAWTLHAAGTVVRATAAAAPLRAEPDEARLQQLAPAEDHYRELAARGLEYGPSFRGVGALSWWSGEALAELRPPGGGHELTALLDGAFQVAVAAAATGAVPVSAEAVRVLRAPAEGEVLRCRAVVRPGSGDERADVVVEDGDGGLVLDVRGLQLAPIREPAASPLEEWLWELRYRPVDAAGPPAAGGGRWLVLGGGDEATALAAALEAAGAESAVVPPDDAARRVREALAAAPAAGVADLRALDVAEDAVGLCAGVADLLRALGDPGAEGLPRLALVTRGAQSVLGGDLQAPAGASLWGLGAVVANERPELRCRRVDLDPAAGAADSGALARELLGGVDEDAVALRAGSRYAARLVRLSPREREEEAPREARAGETYRLELPEPGRLDGLRLRAARRRAPGAGEVEIEVAAAALNFIDVLKAMGVYPGLEPGLEPALGGECAGTVAAVGEGVESVSVGDEVIAVTPSFERTGLLASHVVVPQELVAPKPPRLSFEAAATLPVAFLTADYALHELARVRAGERVLVHAAAGGVGLAALQVARRAGAEVVATSRGAEKREYLRGLGVEHVLDSASVDLVDEVAAATWGRGVDVVLNSLTGPALERSLHALGPHGRFVELGKQELHRGTRLSLAPFQLGVSFLPLDLSRVVADRPEEVGERLRRIAQLVGAGELEPLPADARPADEAGAAFRLMAQAGHVGKLVLRFAGERVRVHEPPASPVRAGGCYLVTGGLGALGLEVARWLVGEGAGSLVLAGRSAPSPEAEAVVAELRAAGAEVVTARADVGSPDELARALALAPAPLRGVVHAAGVLEDALVADLDVDLVGRTMRPKVVGARNLDELTRDQPLDLFLLFSSVAGVLGTPGQGAYAAANAFLDALAHVRRSRGRPATSIAWGPWSRIGLAAGAGRGDRLAARGLASIEPERGIAALGRLLALDTPQVVVAPLDAGRWLASQPGGRAVPLLAELGAHGARAAQPQADAVREALLAAEPGRARSALLTRHVRSEVAAVLGIAAARVGLRKPFTELGLDSLMALELRNRLAATVPVPIGAPAVWNHPTVAALVAHLAERLDGGPAGGDGKASGGDSPTADASPAELERLLAAELAAAEDLLRERA